MGAACGRAAGRAGGGGDGGLPGAWPPPGAAPVDVSGLYGALAGAGHGYGPAFRGVRAAWSDGTGVYAEIMLPEGARADGFAVHPALLDAALHPAALLPVPGDDAAGPGCRSRGAA